MNLNEANSIAEYIVQALNDYAANLNVYGMEFIDEPYEKSRGTAYVWASALSPDKCPKLTAAKRWKLVEEEFSKETLWKFALANAAAMIAKVAVKNAVNMDSEAIYAATNETWLTYTEERIEVADGLVSGKIDLLLKVIDANGDDFYLPIEIKRTDTDKPQDYQVWQLISYMIAKKAQYGFLLALFDGKRSAYKVWTLKRTYETLDEEAGWFLYDGVSLQKFFSEDDYYATLAEHVEASKSTKEALDNHKSADQILEGPGPFTDPTEKPCCWKSVPAELYVKAGKWGNVGDIKSGTGVLEGICPVFHYCHKEWLKEHGLPTDHAPTSIRLGELDGTVNGS